MSFGAFSFFALLFGVFWFCIGFIAHVAVVERERRRHNAWKPLNQRSERFNLTP